MTADINYGAFSEALNNKADRDLNNVTSQVDYVIERGGGATQWYRLWKSGWLEMGGISKLDFGTTTSITFYPSFANINYTMTIGYQCSGHRDQPIIIREKKVDGFTVSNQGQTNSNIIYCNWLISGQGA